MNSWDLKNNAMFLSCWYERSRPVPMICFGVMLLSMMALSLLMICVTVTKPEEIGQLYFYVLVAMQALAILVQGTMFVNHMGARERTCETLDFHRNSPQPVGAKILGLIFGSAWF